MIIYIMVLKSCLMQTIQKIIYKLLLYYSFDNYVCMNSPVSQGEFYFP